MTPEEQLRHVIEAQVKGGYEHWMQYLSQKLSPEDPLPNTLTIILDTEGCKAAYPGQYYQTANFYMWGEDKPYRSTAYDNWDFAQRMILERWNKGEGNNWKAAIQTAYDLL